MHGIELAGIELAALDIAQVEVLQRRCAIPGGTLELEVQRLHSLSRHPYQVKLLNLTLFLPSKLQSRLFQTSTSCAHHNPSQHSTTHPRHPTLPVSISPAPVRALFATVPAADSDLISQTSSRPDPHHGCQMDTAERSKSTPAHHQRCEAQLPRPRRQVVDAVSYAKRST